MPEQTTVPECVGIIMDGNRRWAKERGLPTLEGHRRGFDKIKDLSVWATEAGVGTVVVYAFSTENWNRSTEEVGYLMRLFETMLETGLADIMSRGVRIRFIGQRERFSSNLQQAMSSVEEKTKDGNAGTLAVLLSYGGRTEIIEGVNRLIKKGVTLVTEEELSDSLWTSDIPEPDVIIRTGGEHRLSNFLTWGSVYSELFFTETYWPDFSKTEFDAILAEYAKRERRRGK